MPKYLTHQEQLDVLAEVTDALNLAHNMKRLASAAIDNTKEDPGATAAERAASLTFVVRRAALAANRAQQAFDLIDELLTGVAWDKTTDIRAERTRVNKLRAMARVSGNELLLEIDTKLDWLLRDIASNARQEVAS
jgi:hypothetical protein